MIPIRDENPIRTTPYLTMGLIAVNVAVFIAQAAMPEQKGEAFVWKYGFIPAKLLEDEADFREELPGHGPTVLAQDRWGRLLRVARPVPVEAAVALPAWLTMFTCMFLHGGWLHLLGNMLYLWIFGNNIEDRLGPALCLVFYLATGLVGNLAHTFFVGSWIPLVGASGAISGIMGAYIVLFPRHRVVAVVPTGFYWFTAKMPAWVFLGMYILLQNLFPVFRGGQGNVAYWAHIGGFVSGMALVYAFPHRSHPPPLPRRPDYIDDDDADFVI